MNKRRGANLRHDYSSIAARLSEDGSDALT